MATNELEMGDLDATTAFAKTEKGDVSRLGITGFCYDGAPHGFHADYRPSYRETPAKDGWQRLRAWFQQNGAA
jgi:dienelactone hydrolase